MFPIYITAVAALLFLALAFFAVGQAGATRNGGQTAADAAALAAAQDYRDQLGTALLEAVTDGSALEDLLNGRGIGVGDACEQAQWFAQQNGADLLGGTDAGCVPGYLPTSFTVQVRTQKPVGKTVIPGTESKYAEATAKAVIGPRCTLQPPDGPTATPLPTPTGDEDGDNGGEAEKPSVALMCDGKDVTIDPAHPELFPHVTDLFSVHLAD